MDVIFVLPGFIAIYACVLCSAVGTDFVRHTLLRQQNMTKLLSHVLDLPTVPETS